MAYIGNQPVTGENNSFKILDDISSYTLTFDGSSASIVSAANDTITQNNHRFITGQSVTYSTTGTAIGGLTSDTVYYIIKSDQNTIKLAASLADANNNIAIDLTELGVGTTHTINVAFDGINTKFKATYDDGTKAAITRAAQLTISINGVIQQPNDTAAPTNGFGFDLDSVIVFSVAPTNTDTFWGYLVANNFPTFDISDNTIDSFTGDGSTVDFTLSKTPANNQNVLVTLDGVVQYPSDATTTRSYSVSSNILTFVSAPGNGVDIQVRHIGFAGATSSSVTGFYGRTGNAVLTNADDIVVNTLTVSAGSTSAPSISPSGDSNTGIFFPSPDTVAVSYGGTEALRVDNGGYVGIGTSVPISKLHVIGNTIIVGITTVTSLVETSSITLKENISPIENALDKILQLNPVTYDRKNDITKNEAGLIAEEVDKIIPNIVTKDSEGNPQGINYTKLSVYLIDAIKTLAKELNDLKNGNS